MPPSAALRPAQSRPSKAGSRRRIIVAVVAAIALVTVGWLILRPGSASDSEPPQSLLGEGTGMGAVDLLTDDIDALQAFYQQGVGLELLAEDAESVTLGAGGRELLRLIEATGAPDDPRQAGLYHNAFLFPDEASLALAIANTAAVSPASFQGSSDHRVSQAFYFGDPAGNGVELYVDRPADDWEWSDGQVRMGSEFLDPNTFIEEHLYTSAAAAPIMGHVHLRGGDLELAEEFYADTLGFAVTSRSEGALFMAADGYHHHLAVNTWNSAGAGERPESLGLGRVTIEVANQEEIASIAERLEAAGLDFESTGTRLVVNDPWGTVVEVTVRD